jgi:hypothetical protein
MKLSKTTQTQEVAKHYTELIIKRFGFLTDDSIPKNNAAFVIDGIRVFDAAYGGFVFNFYISSEVYIVFKKAVYSNSETRYFVGIYATKATDIQIKPLYDLVVAMYGDAAKQLKAKYKIKSNSK